VESSAHNQTQLQPAASARGRIGQEPVGSDKCLRWDTVWGVGIPYKHYLKISPIFDPDLTHDLDL